MYTINENNSISCPVSDEYDCMTDRNDPSKHISSDEWEYASWEVVEKIASGETGYRYLIWKTDSEIYGPDELCEPLLLDPTTAGGMVSMYNALSKEENKQKLVDWVAKDRLHFGHMVEVMWKCVR